MMNSSLVVPPKTASLEKKRNTPRKSSRISSSDENALSATKRNSQLSKSAVLSDDKKRYTDYLAWVAFTKTQTAPVYRSFRELSTSRKSDGDLIRMTDPHYLTYSQQRCAAIRMFDFWTDAQRKAFLERLFNHCAQPQLVHALSWFQDKMPLWRVDFTMVLPRFLSLYIFSFLDPRSLCRAAQVNWHWNFVTEQDCLWRSKCLKLGWFLPHVPDQKEYGAWKKHYLACIGQIEVPTSEVEKLDYTIPDLLASSRCLSASIAGTSPRPSTRETTQDFLALSPNTKPQSFQHLPEKVKRSLLLSSSKVHSSKKDLQPNHLTSVMEGESLLDSRWTQLIQTGCNGTTQSLATTSATAKMQAICPIRNVASLKHKQPRNIVAVCDRVAASQLLLAAAKMDTLTICYEFGSTPAASLLLQIKNCLNGELAQSIAFVLPVGSLALTFDLELAMGQLDDNARHFFRQLSAFLIPAEQGGRLDLFSPNLLRDGLDLLVQLNAVTKKPVNVPVSCPPKNLQNSFTFFLRSDWLMDTSTQKSTRITSNPTVDYFDRDKIFVWLKAVNNFSIISERLVENRSDKMNRSIEHLTSSTGISRNIFLERSLGSLLFEHLDGVQLQFVSKIFTQLVKAIRKTSTEQRHNGGVTLALNLLEICGGYHRIEEEIGLGAKFNNPGEIGEKTIKLEETIDKHERTEAKAVEEVKEEVDGEAVEEETGEQPFEETVNLSDETANPTQLATTKEGLLVDEVSVLRSGLT